MLKKPSAAWKPVESDSAFAAGHQQGRPRAIAAGLDLTGRILDDDPQAVPASRPSPLRSFAWRIGLGTPRWNTIRTEVGAVAARLDDARPARAAAQVLGLPGLYRTPACWGGDARPPPENVIRSLEEWAGRCQAASFEIAVALGVEAVPFVLDSAFGPFEVLHGIALRALFRLDAFGSVDEATVAEALERLEGLHPAHREAALDGLNIAVEAHRRGGQRGSRGIIVDALERLITRARNVHTRLAMLDPLLRLDPERARRFLPDLRRQLARQGEAALTAALLVRALEPRDSEARDVLRRFALEHPNAEVRRALELRLRPPYPVPGGSA